MKTRLLIIILGIVIIGVIIALTTSILEYQTEFDQNCHDDNGKVTGFLQCMLIREDFAEPEQIDIVFGGLTEYQREIININKLGCGKVVDSKECRQRVDDTENFFREQNKLEPSNIYHAEIIGLEDSYSEKDPIIFSTYMSSEGKDCVTWVYGIQEMAPKVKKMDTLIVGNNCFSDSYSFNEFDEYFKFNTREKIRTLEKGQYKFVIIAHYYKETKILAEKEFTIN